MRSIISSVVFPFLARNQVEAVFDTVFDGDFIHRYAVRLAGLTR